MNTSLATVRKNYLSEAVERTAEGHKGKQVAANIKTLRLFGVTGVTDKNMFQQTKNFLLDLSIPICYSEKKGLIWMREIGERLDRLFAGLSKLS